MKPPICIDIDNVIARTDEVIREVIKRLSTNHVDLRYEDIIEFDYWKCVDGRGRCFLKSEWQAIHVEFTRNHILRVRPFDEVQRHLHTLGEKFEVHLATSRLPEGADATRKWISIHEIPFSQLHFVEHRKKHLITESFVAAIDDDRDQAELFHRHGVRAFLLAHPWNRLEANSPMIRVNEWGGLVAKILGDEL